MVNSDNPRISMPSTYTLLIADTVLGQFDIHPDTKTLLDELQKPDSIYTTIIQAPSLNILNQLIFSQILSYQHYIQKKLIDYYTKLASVEENDEEETPVYSDSIQELKKNFLLEKTASRDTEQHLFDHVAYVNQMIFSLVYQNTMAQKDLEMLDLKMCKEKLSPCVESAKQLRESLIELREHWRDIAVDFTEKFSGAAQIQLDELSDLELRAELAFFKELGKGN